MSTILKALRRLEQERGKVDRPLREQITRTDGDRVSEGPSRRRWPILAGGIGAGVAAGLAVLFLVRHDAGIPATPEGPTAAAETPRRGPGQLAPVPPKAARREVAAALPSAPAPAPAEVEEVAVVPRRPVRPRIAADDLPGAPGGGAPPAGEAAVVAAAQVAPPAATPSPHAAVAAPPIAVTSAPAPVAPAAPAAPERPRAPAAPVAAAAAPVAAAAPRPQARAAEPKPNTAPPPPATVKPVVKPMEKPAPAVAKAAAPAAAPRPKPAAEPEDFPALRVERTLWHPVAERRTAVIEIPGQEAKEFHEGAEVVGGVRIALIEPSGVVFRFDGQDVLRKIGEGP